MARVAVVMAGALLAVALCLAPMCAAQCAQNCTTDNPCQAGRCDAQTGSCVFEPMDGVPCGPETKCKIFMCWEGECQALTTQCTAQSKCSYAQCDDEKGCIALPDDTACEDNDNNPCMVSKCDVKKGCIKTRVPDGTACDDGNACTSGDRCLKGVCKPTSTATCDDKNPCTKDVCNKATGKCTNTPMKAGTTCSDGLSCTTNDKCTSGGVCLGMPDNKRCDDRNPCTDDQCTSTGCRHVNRPNGSRCNSGGQCQNGRCSKKKKKMLM